MTDSITLRISLTSLSTTSRSLLAISRVNKRRLGQNIECFRRKVFKNGPISGAGMTLLFVQPDNSPNTLPDAVVADLNLPSALVGHNYAHENCGIGWAAVHGLKLVEIALAQMGIPADELKKIDLGDVTLDSVTLTYIYQFSNQEAAAMQMTKLSSSLRAMLPDKLRELHSTNRTLYVDAPDYKPSFYNKTNEQSFAWPDDAPKAAIRAHGQRLIRLEVKLLPSFLKKRGLHLLDAWRGAAEKGFYKTLFDETVGRALRLNEPLRQKLPKPVAREKLSPTDRQVADHFFAGGDPRQFPVIRDAAQPKAAFSKYRLHILNTMETDIGIPWKRHQDMRHYELRQLLVCPPPYKVDKDVADWSFCRANSRAIVARLNAALVDAIERYKISSAASARDRSRNILDEED